jgi:hypothetical protein
MSIMKVCMHVPIEINISDALQTLQKEVEEVTAPFKGEACKSTP